MTPKFQAKFTKQLVRQMIAVVQRDERAALDFVGGTGKLKDIVSYQFAPLTFPQFPAVLIAPMTSLFDRSAVGSLHYTSRFYVGIDVANQDQNVLAELVQDYVVALDVIFNSLDLPDFYTALDIAMLTLPPGTKTTPVQAGAVKDLFIAQHAFDDIRRLSKEGFRMKGAIEIHIDMEEI